MNRHLQRAQKAKARRDREAHQALARAVLVRLGANDDYHVAEMVEVLDLDVPGQWSLAVVMGTKLSLHDPEDPAIVVRSMTTYPADNRRVPRRRVRKLLRRAA